MTVRNGREFLAIPGPTTVPDAVLAAMHRPAIDIYTGELVGITDSCLEDLRAIFGTQGLTYIYAANGHGAWEAAVSNVLSRGDKILALESGLFAMGWGEMGGIMGAEVEILPGSWRRRSIRQRSRRGCARTQAARSRRFWWCRSIPRPAWSTIFRPIRRAMDAAGHGALLMVDTIASLATMPFEMDEWGVDVAVTGAQKG